MTGKVPAEESIKTPVEIFNKKKSSNKSKQLKQSAKNFVAEFDLEIPQNWKSPSHSVCVVVFNSLSDKLTDKINSLQQTVNTQHEKTSKLIKIQDEKLKIQDKKMKTQDKRRKTLDKKVKTQDKRMKSQDKIITTLQTQVAILLKRPGKVV